MRERSAFPKYKQQHEHNHPEFLLLVLSKETKKDTKVGTCDCDKAPTRRLLGAKGIATRSKDATRGSWHRY